MAMMMMMEINSKQIVFFSFNYIYICIILFVLSQYYMCNSNCLGEKKKVSDCSSSSSANKQLRFNISLQGFNFQKNFFFIHQLIDTLATVCVCVCIIDRFVMLIIKFKKKY